MLVMVWRASAFMPPGTSLSVPGCTPICPESNRVFSIRTASENGRFVGYTLPEFRNSGEPCDCGYAGSIPRQAADIAVRNRSAFIGSFLCQPFFETDGVLDALIVALGDRELVVAMLGVKVARTGVVPAAFQQDVPDPRLQRHPLEPSQQQPPHALPAMRPAHTEQQQMGGFVA